jgi:hypothetical protein
VLAACVEALYIDPTPAAVELTQHSDDENYLTDYIDGALHGAFAVDRTPDEVGEPLREAMIGKIRSSAPV